MHGAVPPCIRRAVHAVRAATDGSGFQSTMFLVGLSGGIASGKSTVVAVLRELGCAVIDADVTAREVVQPHLKAYQQIVRYFGTDILLESGEINREALGSIIFSQPEKRQLLNAITHPEIQKEMLKQVLKYFVLGYRYVILDIPLLFETNRLTKFMKHTVLVYWCSQGAAPSFILEEECQSLPTEVSLQPGTSVMTVAVPGARTSCALLFWAGFWAPPCSYGPGECQNHAAGVVLHGSEVPVAVFCP
ncbi:dephospho-CoA kinase domain-containing protein isoform 2-T2 [Mergus octosetaceus]